MITSLFIRKIQILVNVVTCIEVFVIIPESDETYNFPPLRGNEFLSDSTAGKEAIKPFHVSMLKT